MKQYENITSKKIISIFYMKLQNFFLKLLALILFKD